MGEGDGEVLDCVLRCGGDRSVGLNRERGSTEGDRAVGDDMSRNGRDWFCGNWWATRLDGLTRAADTAAIVST